MTRRIATRREEVPYLPKQHIEREATALLGEYCERHGDVTAPPIPIDEIIELHLGLVIELKDMRRLFSFADVHGALWMKEKIVGVDQSLDPAVSPNKTGRYHFTLGHEAGHWRLHREHYLEDPNQGNLFGDGVAKPAYVCRSSEAKKRVELQADFFAAYLLMPREMMTAAWKTWRGNLDPVALDELRVHERKIITSEVLRRGGLAMGQENMDNAMMEWFCRPLADQFQVSAEAMRIRLEDMRLLLREREASLFE